MSKKIRASVIRKVKKLGNSGNRKREKDILAGESPSISGPLGAGSSNPVEKEFGVPGSFDFRETQYYAGLSDE